MGEQCKVLIVDDELLIRQGIKHYLNWEQEGFTVVGEASNGQEALQLIESTHPHIILTDMVMPIMDGEELTKTVKERFPQIEVIILSSFGDFEYVRSTFQSGVVDYILKPKLDAEGLLSVLKKAASRIPDFEPVEKNLDEHQSIGKIISKMISGYEAEYEKSQLLNVFPNNYYCILGLDLRKHPDKGKTDFITQLVENLEQVFISKGVVPHSFNYDQNTIGVLLNYNRSSLPELTAVAEQFASSHPPIGLVLTKEFKDFSHLGKIVKERLLKLLQYRFYFPNVPLLTEKNLGTEVTECASFDLDWFTSELKRKHFESAFGYLQSHVEEFSRCYKTDVFEFKSFFGNIIFNITVLLANMGYEVKQLEKDRYIYFQSIEETPNAEETVVVMEQFIDEAKKCIFSMPVQQEDLNIKEIMQYMRDHYAEPITLKDVAKHFHFNPSYLSSYFSSHNDEGFIEYLNKVRIEEAEKLLTSANAPISEISSMVGYSDHSYFCKVFKKATGSSPSQYRRKQNLR
ncbi:response regulator transcription factor [Bacillus sp. ISL-35]|uniref:response regulator transcription factor n=1 Tax=Bacillus sp. ISL-35 TaxID=2819122 RepID=UPI001BE9DD99|nr:response regulator transcription factor [Bacillus sp. ISL-35]MBT2678722.1 response regulator transcription factor [Bacillus sp. ISL-35]MBT2703714.1 response regulator transcription factor [Chryseobacterium sp. ISL-80]